MAPWLKTIPLALAACFASAAHASSTRGLVVSMDHLPGSAHCVLVIMDDDFKRKMSFLARKDVCEQRGAWVGKTAEFHLSLTDVGGRLAPMATRAKPWPAKSE